MPVLGETLMTVNQNSEVLNLRTKTLSIKTGKHRNYKEDICGFHLVICSFVKVIILVGAA